MAKSIKFNNNKYLSYTSIVCGRTLLSDVIDKRFAQKVNSTFVGDSVTTTITVSRGAAYLYINTHINKRCFLLVCISAAGSLSIDKIFYNASDAIPTMTLDGTTLTVKSPAASRGYLFRLINSACG